MGDVTATKSGAIMKRSARYALIAEAARISTGFEVTPFVAGMAFALRAELARRRYRRWEEGLSIMNKGLSFDDEDSSPRHRDFVTGIVAIDLYLFEKRNVVVICESVTQAITIAVDMRAIAGALEVHHPNIVRTGNDDRSVLTACRRSQLGDRDRSYSGVTILPARRGLAPLPADGGLLIARSRETSQSSDFWRRKGRACFPDGP